VISLVYLDLNDIPSIFDIIDFISKNLKNIAIYGGIIAVILVVILIMRLGRLTKEAVKNTLSIPGFILTVTGIIVLIIFFKKWGIL